jgi:chromosome segregation ATPase
MGVLDLLMQRISRFFKGLIWNSASIDEKINLAEDEERGNLATIVQNAGSIRGAALDVMDRIQDIGPRLAESTDDLDGANRELAMAQQAYAANATPDNADNVSRAQNMLNLKASVVDALSQQMSEAQSAYKQLQGEFTNANALAQWKQAQNSLLEVQHDALRGKAAWAEAQSKLLEAQRAIANVASAPLSESMLNQDAKQFQRKINRDAGEIEVLHGLIRNQGGVVSMPGTGVSSGARAAIAASNARLGLSAPASSPSSSAATGSQSSTRSVSGRE